MKPVILYFHSLIDIYPTVIDMIRRTTLFLTMIRRYGFLKALLLLFQSLRSSGLSVIRLPGLAQPVYLRNGTSDWPTFHQVFTFEEYHLKLPFSPEYIIDCGANIGLAVAYLKYRYPSARIIAIEPEASNFGQARKNTEHYRDVHLVQAAIWNRKTTLTLVPGNDHRHWSFFMKETEPGEKGTTAAVCIDDLQTEFNFPRIDILKVDIEGGEQELFDAHYEHWLPATRVIVLETHDQDRPGTSRSFFQRLGENNFSVILQGENFVCVRNEYLQQA